MALGRINRELQGVGAAVAVVNVPATFYVDTSDSVDITFLSGKHLGLVHKPQRIPYLRTELDHGRALITYVPREEGYVCIYWKSGYFSAYTTSYVRVRPTAYASSRFNREMLPSSFLWNYIWDDRMRLSGVQEGDSLIVRFYIHKDVPNVFTCFPFELSLRDENEGRTDTGERITSFYVKFEVRNNVGVLTICAKRGGKIYEFTEEKWRKLWKPGKANYLEFKYLGRKKFEIVINGERLKISFEVETAVGPFGFGPDYPCEHKTFLVFPRTDPGREYSSSSQLREIADNDKDYKYRDAAHWCCFGSWEWEGLTDPVVESFRKHDPSFSLFWNMLLYGVGGTILTVSLKPLANSVRWMCKAFLRDVKEILWISLGIFIISWFVLYLVFY